MLMNIADVIKDALRGRAPRRMGTQYGPGDPTPPADFLRTEVWPLLKEARLELESRNYKSIAVRAAKDDPAQSHALLILGSSGHEGIDGCFLRFMIVDEHVCVTIKNPARNDQEPVPLHTPGSLLLVKELIADFIYQCLGTAGKHAASPTRATPRPEPRGHVGDLLVEC
jgi:hypothetical protein